MSKKTNKDIDNFLDKFNQELAQAINDDLINFFNNSAMSIKGPIIKNSAIQIKMSADKKILVAFLREKSDSNLEKTYIEIDLLSDKYPSGSKTKKILEKFKKELKKLQN